MYNLHGIAGRLYPRQVRRVPALNRYNSSFQILHSPQYIPLRCLARSFGVFHNVFTPQRLHRITDTLAIPQRTSHYSAQLRPDDEDDISKDEVEHFDGDKSSKDGRTRIYGTPNICVRHRGDANKDEKLEEQEDTESTPVQHVSKTESSEIWPSEPVHEIIASRSKVDLSYQDVRQRETLVATAGRVSSPPIPPTKFRGNAGMRLIVHQYLQHVDPLLRKASRTAIQDDQLDYWISKTFTPRSLQALTRGNHTVEEIVTWAWILGAQTGDLSIRRHLVIERSCVSDGQGSLPQFVLLQILRSEQISTHSLSILLDEIESALEHKTPWTQDAGAILLIRLLRHGRLTSVSCYERIADLAPRVLPLRSSRNLHDDTQRLTHFYNRFLSLLALPLASHPFLSVDVQQRAQLKIARSMMHSQLQIPLNREGYRALARVQLLHQKTIDEQQWSSVKGPSWPPWRRDELGIDETVDYPGQHSRVSKVIKRLLEAGYGPESVEHEAKILGGQDTDKSPTVQVRRLTSRRPLAWIRDMLRDRQDEESPIDHHVWAARVAATRSVREAWLCFYSYQQVTMSQQRQLRVYHEMFHKLFARTQGTDQKAQPSPGDGKEIFPDPVSTRDLVYVPKEPPSIDELYTQMLQDGVHPGGRLLASLIDGAHSLKHGLDIIGSSSLGDVKKDVLLHPEKYPGYVIRNLYSTVPDYLLASYIGLLMKQYKFDTAELYWPGSKSAEERGALPTTPVKPLVYGMTLLQIWKPTYLPAYHAALEGICTHAMMRRPKKNDGMTSRLHSYAELWKMAEHTLDLLEQTRLQVDLSCYRKLVLLVRNIMIRAPSQFGSSESHLQRAVSTIKTAFTKALDGRVQNEKLLLPSSTLSLSRQPYWKDIEALILLLGFDQDFSTIFQIWRWLHKHQASLECVDSVNSYKMQRLLCATRVAIEASWSSSTSVGADAEEVWQLRQVIRQWGWPEDVDVAEFKGHHQVWLEGMRAAARSPLE